jgi:hypothetical protein
VACGWRKQSPCIDKVLVVVIEQVGRGKTVERWNGGTVDPEQASTGRGAPTNGYCKPIQAIHKLRQLTTSAFAQTRVYRSSRRDRGLLSQTFPMCAARCITSWKGAHPVRMRTSPQTDFVHENGPEALNDSCS